MAKVRIRFPSHIAKMLDPQSTGWLVREEEVSEGGTVDDLLSALVATYPHFREAVFNPDAGLVNEQINVVLNERLLMFQEISQIKLAENDTIALIPIYYGG